MMTTAEPSIAPFSRTSQSEGLSGDAVKLAEKFDMLLDALDGTRRGEQRDVARASLREAAAEASADNWDGYGGLAANERALAHAFRMIEMLPWNIPAPDFSVGPMGQLIAAWDRGPQRELVASIGVDGMISYAIRLDRSRLRGAEPMADALPFGMAAWLDRLYA